MAADVRVLKENIIDEFEKWLQQASYGQFNKYENILCKISLVEVWDSIDNVDPIYEFLISN